MTLPLTDPPPLAAGVTNNSGDPPAGCRSDGYFMLGGIPVSRQRISTSCRFCAEPLAPCFCVQAFVPRGLSCRAAAAAAPHPRPSTSCAQASAHVHSAPVGISATPELRSRTRVEGVSGEVYENMITAPSPSSPPSNTPTPSLQASPAAARSPSPPPPHHHPTRPATPPSPAAARSSPPQPG